jgi:hypothetical protein
MSDKPGAVSFVRKFRQQLRSSVDGRIRRRIILSVVALVTIATGTAIADVYLRNLFRFSISPAFPARTAILGASI